MRRHNVEVLLNCRYIDAAAPISVVTGTRRIPTTEEDSSRDKKLVIAAARIACKPMIDAAHSLAKRKVAHSLTVRVVA